MTLFSDPATGKNYKTAPALKAAITRRTNLAKEKQNINEPRFPTVADPDNLDPDEQIAVYDSIEDAKTNNVRSAVFAKEEPNLVVSASQQRMSVMDTHSVEMHPECIPFIPGTNKLLILENWCIEHCTAGWKVLGKNGMNWLFDTSYDANAFELAWNTRTAKKINLTEDND